GRPGPGGRAAGARCARRGGGGRVPGGSGIVRATWGAGDPVGRRPASRRVARRALLALVVAGAVGAGVAAPAVARPGQGEPEGGDGPGRAVVISLPTLRWDDVLEHEPPAVLDVVRRSAIASMSVRTI